MEDKHDAEEGWQHSNAAQRSYVPMDSKEDVGGINAEDTTSDEDTGDETDVRGDAFLRSLLNHKTQIAKVLLQRQREDVAVGQR